ncbi:MAG: sigma 54-interacting transcriptional regulator [Polyangiaceae bacterium]|nr:sigma 54-interacting transcriptional regulator [Polyangiaceae bacterium]
MDDNTFFRQATLAICSHLDIEHALQACLRVIVQRIPADGIYLELYDFTLRVMRVVASATLASGQRLNRAVPIPEAGMDHAEAVDSTDVLIINDPAAHPIAASMNRVFGEPGATILAMPLAIEAEPVGALVLTRRSGEPFTAGDARLLSSLNEPIAIAMSNALRHDEVVRLKEQLAADNRFLQHELRHLSGEHIVGADFGLREVMARVHQVAALDSPVLLLGETGVGKEVIANAIHHGSARREGPFIKVNSGAIPEALVDSELFGHEKGAFTGAVAQRRGRFERAHGGTLFLDEIGELPMAAQIRLLRVIQHREFERVGGTVAIPVDVRLVFATHRDLGAMVAAGRFREDLWFRVNVFPIAIPPLRLRRDDIRALVHHFVERKCRELKLGTPPPLAPGAVEPLLEYDWPGNVRELENVVERALIISPNGPLSFEPLIVGRPSALASAPASIPLHTLDEATAHHIRRALDHTQGKIHGPGGAAELLGIKPNTLRYRMDKLGIAYRKRH